MHTRCRLVPGGDDDDKPDYDAGDDLDDEEEEVEENSVLGSATHMMLNCTW